MNAYRILARKSQRQKPLRTKHMWADNIKMDLGEIRWGDMDCIDLGRDGDQWSALANTSVIPQVP